MKKIQGKQIQDSTIEQRSMKVLKETITDNNSVTNKEYVLEKVNQSLSGLYQSKLNLNMTASGATVGELACESSVIEFPISPVMVKLNGILMSVGSDKDFYFSPDGGSTKRVGGFAEKGDKLYWNSSDYDLDDQDEIDLVYLVGYEYVDGISGSVTELNPIYKSIVVKFNGGLSETMIVVINGTEIEVGNIGGNFVWNVDDPIDEHTFTQVGESYVSTIGGEEYTIWFDGFGSLIFSVRKGNFKVENNTQPFIITVKTDNAGTSADNQFYLPMYGSDFTVKCSDGQVITGCNAPLTIDFAVAGTYQIEVSGSYDYINFNNEKDKSKLTKINQIGKNAWTQMNNAFYGCDNLVSVEGQFHGNIINFSYTFANCTNLTAIPVGLFDNNVNASDFSWTFANCTKLTAIPVGLFDNNVNASDFSYTFNNCTNLTAIPAGLFDMNINATNFYYTFYNCTKLTAIPAGLFDKNISASNFSYTFASCTKLTAIPAGLFDNNVSASDFSWTFRNCTKLTAIPAGLFDMNINATSFNQTFANCTNLTAIPAGLFDMNINATNFYYTFASCTNLTAIPAGLFDKNISASNFNQTFRNCTKLTAIPAGLFDMNINATSFNQTFAFCTNLTAIPAGLFDKNISASNFSYTFYYCTKTTLNASIFGTDKLNRFKNKGINFTSCFLIETFTGTQGTAPDLWNFNFGTGTPTTTSCFGGHTASSLTNFAEIPTNWK